MRTVQHVRKTDCFFTRIVKIKIHVSVHVKHEQVEHIRIANDYLRQEQYYTKV